MARLHDPVVLAQSVEREKAEKIQLRLRRTKDGLELTGATPVDTRRFREEFANYGWRLPMQEACPSGCELEVWRVAEKLEHMFGYGAVVSYDREAA